MEDAPAPEKEKDWWTAVIADATHTDPQYDGDDPPAFNFLSGELAGLQTVKIPLEQAANLLLMREAADQIRREEITTQEFLEKVSQVAQIADNGIKLFSSEVVKAETAKLPPEQQHLIQIFEQQVYVLKEGTDLMAAYAETGVIDELDRGLALVEESMEIVDEVQDRALEIQEEEAAAKADEPEEDVPYA